MASLFQTFYESRFAELRVVKMMCVNRFVISIMMACLLAVTVSTPSVAEELKAVGKASVKVTSDESTAYKRALKNAKKDAVRELAIKVIGPEAGKDETITDALDSLADQLDEYFDDEETDTVDDKVEVKITARIEASEFRSLMREQGVKGSNTSAAAVKIAVMIDEYVTVPTDFSQPESIKTFFKSSKKSSFSDQSLRASSSVAARDSKASSNQSVDARSAQATSVRANEKVNAASAAKISGQGGSMATADSVSASRSGSLDSASASSLKAKTSATAQSSAFAKSSNVDKKDVRASSSDEVTFSNEVKFQSPSDKRSNTRTVENAFFTLFGEESIKVRDSLPFRSAFFKSKQQSLRDLTEGEGFSKFISAAAADKQLDADYLMFGSATIMDLGKDPLRPTETLCGGFLTVRAVHVRTSVVLTSGEANENGSGGSIDLCAADLAKKLAQEAVPVVTKILLKDFKEAQMFGSQFDVIVVGTKLGLRVSRALADIFEELKIAEAQKKSDSAQLIDYSVIYKGNRALDEELAFKLMEKLGLTDEPVRKVVGSTITVCLDSCKLLVK